MKQTIQNRTEKERKHNRFCFCFHLIAHKNTQSLYVRELSNVYTRLPLCFGVIQLMKKVIKNYFALALIWKSENAMWKPWIEQIVCFTIFSIVNLQKQVLMTLLFFSRSFAVFVVAAIASGGSYCILCVRATNECIGCNKFHIVSYRITSESNNRCTVNMKSSWKDKSFMRIAIACRFCGWLTSSGPPSSSLPSWYCC